MSDDALITGTVCVAPRARSANRRVYFLELQGDDETRHHVLCKATKLGGLLPDETTVQHMHTPSRTTRPMHARATRVYARTMHVPCICRVMHRWRCTGTCGKGTRWPFASGGVSCAPLSQIATAALYMRHGGCTPVYQVRWQGRARADPYPPRHPREHSEHRVLT